MENASKALIMAGSILMAMLVIGALVFMYNQITGIEQTRTDNDELSKITDYSQKFEQYNKTIYGSELMSLANLKDDYKKTQSDQYGYTEITIQITIKNSIPGTTYFQACTKADISTFLKDKNGIEKDISKYEKPNSAYKNKSVKYYSQLSNREIATIYRIDFSSDEADYDIFTNKQIPLALKNLLADIENYKNLKTTYTEFKNKKFKCTKMEYDLNGRVNYMLFEEK